tara:strand:+ start:9476 stop:10546 length:1071 start_codon:yes stop_codon:yes gene_type:complete
VSIFNYKYRIEDYQIKESHKFDKLKLSEYLSDKLKDFSSLVAVGQFNVGQSNPTFIIESTEGKRYVLRKKPPGKLLPSAHAVDREYRVQKALYETNVPVAKMYLYCEDENIIGTSFYVMEYLEGRVIEDTTLSGFDPDERIAIYDSMNESLAALHNVNVEKVGLSDFGRPGSYFIRQIKRWSSQWELSKQHDMPEMPLLKDWLISNLPSIDETTIVHGDYRLGNLIYSLTEPKVIAVLDWELSTLGHPLADLGYNLMHHVQPTSMYSGLKGLNLEALGIPNIEAYMQNYCKRTNRDFIDTTFYIVFSLYRNVAILEGVLARGRAGNASSSLAEERGALGPVLATLAWNFVKENNLD